MWTLLFAAAVVVFGVGYLLWKQSRADTAPLNGAEAPADSTPWDDGGSVPPISTARPPSTRPRPSDAARTADAGPPSDAVADLVEANAAFARATSALADSLKSVVEARAQQPPPEVRALVCPGCGAPVPTTLRTQGTCAFCGAVLVV